MTLQQKAAALLPIIQAAVEGKVIQVRNVSGNWQDITDTSIFDMTDKYRIKPLPREVWIHTNPDNNMQWIDSDHERCPHCRKFVEVMP